MSVRPGSVTRNLAGQFTPRGIRAHISGGFSMSQVIATETCIVHNDALGIDQKVFAGLPVPPDLVAAYKRLVGDAAAQQSPAEQVAELERDRQPGEEVSTGDDRDGDDLDAMAVDELAKLAADRGVEIVGTGHNGRVLKADLVDALSA